MLIWLEIELHSKGRDIYSIAASEWLNFGSFVKKSWLDIKMSIEYYPKTIEYNFKPHTLTKAYIKNVAKFIQAQMKKHNLVISNKAPWFVWTHVHIFDLKFRKLKWDAVLQTTMSHINKWFSNLRIDSQRRLALSHQLWWNYVYNSFWDYHDICSDNWIWMAYPTMWNHRPKYNPYIVSKRSKKWKPRSVEIRIIPNEFLFTDQLYELLTAIQKWKHETLNINDTLYQWIVNVGR